VTYVPSATVVALERQGGRVMEGRACVRSGSIVKDILKAGVLYFVLVLAAGSCSTPSARFGQSSDWA